MNMPRKRLIFWVGLLAVLATGTVLIVVPATRSGLHAWANPAGQAPDEPVPGPENAISVTTIRPRSGGTEFAHTIIQPVFVEGIYQADLMARVAGLVKFITKDIGDRVKKDEVLVELDVPDLVQEVEQKKAVVKQAEQDARAAEANIPILLATEKEATAQIREKQAQVELSESNCKLYRTEVSRYTTLVKRQAAVASALDEVQQKLEAAEANLKSAQVAVDTARANLEEFTAKLAAARVDVDVKKARIDVAKADQARAQAMVDFAKIPAPFNGVIVSRSVDPGSFVQNASTGQPKPLLTVISTDRVTLVTWVPEKDAPLVNKRTEVHIELDALGDRGIRDIQAKVTRLSHWLDPSKGRDMRVEVDLDNPEGSLEPGMYGTIRLVLQKFHNPYLLPAGAVFGRSGQNYIFEVQNGRAHLVPIRRQLDEGSLVKVARIVRQVDPNTGHTKEVMQDLTGTEEIIRSGQGEIADGQVVKANRVDW